MENFPEFVVVNDGYYQITIGSGGSLHALRDASQSTVTCRDPIENQIDEQAWLVSRKPDEQYEIVHATTGFYLGVQPNSRDRDAFIYYYGSGRPDGLFRMKKATPNSEYAVLESVCFPGYVLDLPYSLQNKNINLQPVGWPEKSNQGWKFTPVQGMIPATTLQKYKAETSTLIKEATDAKDQFKQLTSNIETEQNKVTELRRNLQDADAKAIDLAEKLTAAETKLKSANEVEIAKNIEIESLKKETESLKKELESSKKELGAAKAKGEADKNTIEKLTKAAEVAAEAAKAKEEDDKNTIEKLTKAAEAAKAKEEDDKNSIEKLTKAVQSATATAELANNTEIESLKKETESLKKELESSKKELGAAKAKEEADKNAIEKLTEAVQAATLNKESSIDEGEEEEGEEEEEFKGKLAIIDGAGTIFGRAVALQLQQRGAILALNDQDSIRLEETTKSLPPEVVICKSSYKTTIASEAVTFTSLVNKKYPDGISYIFNCASFQELESPPYESQRLCALIYLTRATIPYLAANASFVNTSCMSGRWLQDHTPPDPDTQKQAIDYAVQHGIIGYSRSLVQELQDRRPGVRVNIIATEYIDKIEEKGGEVADTAAEATLYLFSQKSKGMNGSIVDVDEQDEDKEGKGLYF